MITSDYLDTNHGGLENHIYYLSRALIAKGHDVVVVRVGEKEGVREPPRDVPFTWIGTSPGHLATWLLRCLPARGVPSEFLRRIVRSWQSRSLFAALDARDVDIWHQHDFVESVLLTKRLAKSGRAPVLWTNHLGEYLVLHRSGLGRLLLRWLTAHYSSATAPSRELSRLGMRVDALHYIPNGVDTEAFNLTDEASRRDSRVTLGWKDNERVILVPRRWAPSKGVLDLALALPVLGVDGPKRIVFAGAGTVEYPVYARRVREAVNGLPDNWQIEVHERVPPDDMAAYYRAADVTCIPSYLEATSLAALEAMASGSLVVASNVGGLPEIIVDGVTGFLFESNDQVSLTSSLKQALNISGATADRIRNAARASVVSKNSWSAVCESFDVLYRLLSDENP